MSKKSKIILICLAALIVVAVGVTLPLVLIRFNENKQLASPTVEVFESENLIVFQASKINNAKEYKFIITTPDGSTLPFSSESNIFSLDFENESSSWKERFNVAGIYSVQCYAVAEDANNNSFKSAPLNFTRILQLKTPRLEKQGKNFIWDTILNADIYEIIISSNNGSTSKIFTPIDGYIQSVSLTTLIKEFNLISGQYTITVKAASNNDYYLASVYSNQQTFIVD